LWGKREFNSRAASNQGSNSRCLLARIAGKSKVTLLFHGHSAIIAMKLLVNALIFWQEFQEKRPIKHLAA
jgi:hypothetical protein